MSMSDPVEIAEAAWNLTQGRNGLGRSDWVRKLAGDLLAAERRGAEAMRAEAAGVARLHSGGCGRRECQCGNGHHIAMRIDVLPLPGDQP
jgi:hypothetical protein